MRFALGFCCLEDLFFSITFLSGFNRLTGTVASKLSTKIIYNLVLRKIIENRAIGEMFDLSEI